VPGPAQGEETPKEIEQVPGLLATLDSNDGSDLLIVCFETWIEMDLARSQQEQAARTKNKAMIKDTSTKIQTQN
jgi:hypothetical protein